MLFKIGYIKPHNFKKCQFTSFISRTVFLRPTCISCVFYMFYLFFSVPSSLFFFFPLLDALLHPIVLGIDPQTWAWLHGWDLPPDSLTHSFRTASFFNSLKLQPLSRIITFWHSNIIPKSLFLLCLILETTQIYKNRNGHADTQIVSASSYWT